MIARHWGRKTKTPTCISSRPVKFSARVRCLESSPLGGDQLVFKIDGYYLHGLHISYKRLHLEPGTLFKIKLCCLYRMLFIFRFPFITIWASKFVSCNCIATLWLQDIEVGKQKHLHVYQADQLNFRQGVGVWNLHPLGGLHIGGIYEITNDLICFSILLRNNCHNGGHFEN
jgi:hypothetical protein